MLQNYEKYNDIVLYDSTYKTNRFSMPLGVFIGCDCKGKNIVFAIALLSDETALTYTKLFTLFKRKLKIEPKALLTDGDLSIIAAAKETLKTKHRLCEWHLKRNIAKHLGPLKKSLKHKYAEYENKIAKLLKTENYETDYIDLINDDNLTKDVKDYLKYLDKIKELWNNNGNNLIFTSGMHTTQRSESFNGTLKYYLSHNSQTPVFILVKVINKLTDLSYLSLRTFTKVQKICSMKSIY